MEKKTTFLADLMSGITGGAAGVMTGQPFDTVKVQMQTSSHKSQLIFTIIAQDWSQTSFLGAFSCALDLYKHNGLRSFYAGASPSLIAGVAELGVLFAGLGRCKLLISSLSQKPVEQFR